MKPKKSIYKYFFIDVALVELREPIEFRENAIPICLPEETDGDFFGKKATVIGWGRLAEFGESSKTLQKVDVKIISNTFFIRL